MKLNDFIWSRTASTTTLPHAHREVLAHIFMKNTVYVVMDSRGNPDVLCHPQKYNMFDVLMTLSASNLTATV
jgi:hypothetical protein